MEMTKKILVLSSADTPVNKDLNEQFIARIQALAGNEYEITWRMLADVSFKLGEDWQALLLSEQQLVDDFDLIYFKSYYRYSEIAVALVEYLAAKHIPFMCQELDSYISFSKLSQYARMSRNGIRIPKTQFVARKHLQDSFEILASYLGLPFVLKAIGGRGGDLNFLIDSAEKFDRSVHQAGEEEMIAQSFVSNEGDMRILVLDDDIKLVILRRRQDSNTHLNNTSQGAEATEISPNDLDEETRTMALQAAKIMRREVAGVDIMLESASKRPYLLEINASPQVASGALTDRKIELYHQLFKQKLDKNH